MEKDWHSSHFCCWQCDESLTGQRYVLRDDHPYCIKCYENVFANTCEECNKIIGIDSKVRLWMGWCSATNLKTNFWFLVLQDLSYKEKHWHEACFLCNKCRVSLVDKQFGSKADKIYCGNCYDSQFASRCDGCSEIFRAGKFDLGKRKFSSLGCEIKSYFAKTSNNLDGREIPEKNVQFHLVTFQKFPSHLAKKVASADVSCVIGSEGCMWARQLSSKITNIV